MMATRTKVVVVSLAAATSAGCATRPPIEANPAQARSPAVAAMPRPVGAAPVRAKPPEPAPLVPLQAKAPAPAAAPSQSALSPQPPGSPEQQLAVLRVEAGALVTRVNGEPSLACTQSDCRIPLPAGTHQLTVGYKDTETRAGSRVTFASMHSRVIEITLEPGHTYSLTASGRYTPRWWIAVEDRTENKIVYTDRVASGQ